MSRWTETETADLLFLRSERYNYAQIGERLGRTQLACRLKHWAVVNAGESAAAESAAGDAADEEDAAESAAGDAADEEDAAESAAGDATDEEDAAAADTGGDIPMADATGTAGTEGLATLCAAAAADEHRARDAAETAAIDAAIAAGNNDMVRTLARRGVDEEEFLADVGELGGDLWSEVGRRHGLTSNHAWHFFQAASAAPAAVASPAPAAPAPAPVEPAFAPAAPTFASAVRDTERRHAVRFICN